MQTKLQLIIVYILGLESLISLIGIFVLVAINCNNTTLILALIPLITTPVGILGGFLQGKKLADREVELIDQTLQQSMEQQTKENLDESV